MKMTATCGIQKFRRREKIKHLSKYWGSSTQDDPCRSNIGGSWPLQPVRRWRLYVKERYTGPQRIGNHEKSARLTTILCKIALLCRFLLYTIFTKPCVFLFKISDLRFTSGMRCPMVTTWTWVQIDRLFCFFFFTFIHISSHFTRHNFDNKFFQLFCFVFCYFYFVNQP